MQGDNLYGGVINEDALQSVMEARAPKPKRPRGRPRKHDLEDAEPAGAA